MSADEILVVAGPDLANLRNAKNLIDLLRASRPNDHRPRYCLNQVGIPKRPEISPADLQRRSKQVRSRSFRLSHSYLARLPTTVR